MAKIQVDMVWNGEIQGILDMIEKNGGKIVSHIAYGPAGGNPLLELEFPTKENVINFMEILHPDDVHQVGGREFIESRIYE